MNHTSNIAWAAGLFEGEGWITLLPSKQPVCGLAMRDKDVVNKFFNIVKCGHVWTRYSRKPTHSNQITWTLSKKDDCERLLKLFLPFFGLRRKARAIQIMKHCAYKQKARIRKNDSAYKNR